MQKGILFYYCHLKTHIKQTYIRSRDNFLPLSLTGGAANSVRRLQKAVALRIRGGVSSPDHSQAGPAGQGAETGTGL